MTVRTISNGLYAALRAFRHARGGNVAVTFAIISLVVIGAAGVAVDFSRASSVRTAMQDALDSTALMLSKEAATDSSDQLQKNALKYFQAMFTRPEAQNISVSATYTASTSQVMVNASANVPTSIMSVLGYDDIAIDGASTATWRNAKLRVALVLDNTGSMADDGKLGALQTAAHNLLGTLKSAEQASGDVEVAIVPFANGVNVGPANVSETWLDWSYYTDSGGAGWSSWGGSSWGNSNSWSSNSGSWNSSNGTWTSSSGTTSCSWSTCWNSSGDWSTDSTNTDKSHWQGCVMDRDQDYDVNNTVPTTAIQSTMFPAVYNAACPAPIMPLTNDWTGLNSLVDAMVATGTTNQTVGLAWGWQALTPGDPFNNLAMPMNAQQAIVMLTDGLNTENRWTTNQSAIDARTQKVCDNIKAAGITLFTIQVNTGGDPTSALLQNCASDSSKFYLLTSSNQIITAFNDIGTKLSKLRIAR